VLNHFYFLLRTTGNLEFEYSTSDISLNVQENNDDTERSVNTVVFSNDVPQNQARSQGGPGWTRPTLNILWPRAGPPPNSKYNYFYQLSKM
jgi:hypothetical protein